jgi:hypothetical protein
LGSAEAEFDLFITSDQNIRYQKKLTNRAIATSLDTGPPTSPAAPKPFTISILISARRSAALATSDAIFLGTLCAIRLCAYLQKSLPSLQPAFISLRQKSPLIICLAAQLSLAKEKFISILNS